MRLPSWHAAQAPRPGGAPAASGHPPMADKKSYPLRINADVLQAMQRWSDDELRSLNAQIEYVLRESLRKAGRLAKSEREDQEEPAP